MSLFSKIIEVILRDVVEKTPKRGRISETYAREALDKATKEAQRAIDTIKEEIKEKKK